MGELWYMIRPFVFQAPVLAMAIIGIIFTFVRLSRHRTAAMPALIGLFLVGGSALVQSLFALMWRFGFEAGMGGDVLSWMMGALDFVCSLALAAGIGLLLWAVFRGRLETAAVIEADVPADDWR
jgi:hypothetical protein